MSLAWDTHGARNCSAPSRRRTHGRIIPIPVSPRAIPEGRLVMEESGPMDVVYAKVGSVDIGKRILAACRRRMTTELKFEKEVRKFRTLTKDLTYLWAGHGWLTAPVNQ